jgi:hypothetical protein
MTNSFTLIDFYSLFGSTVAIILAFVQLKAHHQDRPIIDIHIKGVHIDQFHIDINAPDYDLSIKKRGHTNVTLTANVMNKGRQPVTISKIQFFASGTYFQYIDMHYSKIFLNEDLTHDIDNIRLESNDSQNIKIFANECDYFTDFACTDCYALFYIGNQKIKKRIFIDPFKDITNNYI